MTELDALLKAAWNDHGDNPQAVADRLVANAHRVERSEQVAPFVRLLVHVYGEHLGQWQMRASALAGAASAFAGRNETARAISALTKALKIAEAGRHMAGRRARRIPSGTQHVASRAYSRGDCTAVCRPHKRFPAKPRRRVGAMAWGPAG